MAGPYYVDVTTGDDGDSGLTEALAFATLSFAAGTVAAGELVYVKGSASYVVEDASNDCVLYIDTAGGNTTGIKWEGYTTTPGDGGLFTIDASTNTLAYGIRFNVFGNAYNMVKNCRVTGASSAGYYSSADDRGCLWNCRADNCGSNGMTLQGNWLLVSPQSDNNTGHGISVGFYGQIVNPVAHTNTANGITASDVSVIINPLVYNNGATGDGIDISGSSQVIYGGSIDCDNNAGANGLYSGSARSLVAVINTILFDCGVGVSFGAANNNSIAAQNNLFYSNATDRTNFPAGDNDVAGSSDPFTASATRDYTLKSGSEAIDAGVDASDTLDIFD